MEELPIARNPDQKFLAGVCERLDRQNELLAEIRDRLPTPEGGQPGPVSAGQEPGPAEVEITEPAVPAVPGEAVPLAEPAAPAKRPPAKKSTPKTPAKAPAKTGAKKTTGARATGRARTPKGST